MADFARILHDWYQVAKRGGVHLYHDGFRIGIAEILNSEADDVHVRLIVCVIAYLDFECLFF